MTEQKDEIRLKQLLSVFGEDRQKEIIEILHRDQIRYHQEQLILSGVSQQRELLNFMEHLSMYHNIDEVIDCTKYQQIIEQYKI